MNPDIEQEMKNAEAELKAAGFSDVRKDVRLLMAATLGVDDNAVLFYKIPLTVGQKKIFGKMILQRLQHKPVDKILSRKGFYKYDFEVGQSVLSPRPDTERLVEAVIDYVGVHDVKNILDLGTGSGCILLSVLAEFPELQGTGVDISDAALKIARRNALRLKAEKQVRFIQNSWFSDGFVNELGEVFDVVVSNPPYIKSDDIASLDAEVSLYDPQEALDGGKDGLVSYRRLAEIMPKLLRDNGMVFLEAGAGQYEEITRIFCSYGFNLVQIVKDFGGIERCVILKK